MVAQDWRTSVYSIPVIRPRPPNPIYVDTIYGSQYGTGSYFNPVNTLSVALSLCAGLPDYQIKVRAPENNPLRQEVTFNTSKDVYISGVDSEPWYIYGSELQVSGWLPIHGGVYRKTLGYTAINQVVVTSINELVVNKIFNLKLSQNIVTPAEPNAGEFGYEAGVIYLNLPDGSNPNFHFIEVSRRNFCVGTIGFGMLTIDDCVSRYAMINGIHNGQSTQPEGTGFLTVSNSLVEYCVNGGVGTSGRNEITVCNNVKAYRIGNDGFNLHAPTGGEGEMVLNDCEGSYCGDKPGESAQGASPHERTKMIINGGKYFGNVSGIVAIEYANLEIHGDTKYGPVIIDSNLRLGNTPGTIESQASLAWLYDTTGLVTGEVIVKNSGGVGVRRSPSAVVDGINLVKSTNNALPDIL